MELQVGARYRSAFGDAEVIVIKAAAGELGCAGHPMVPSDDPPTPAPTGSTDGPAIVLGKRYVDEAGTVEVLCTKPGAGELSVDGRPLGIKSAKPLPSSD